MQHNTFTNNYDLQQLKKIYFLLFIALSTVTALGQFSKTWRGKVLLNTAVSEGIYVFNLKNKQATTTQKGGYFIIEGTIGDTLVLSGFKIKAIKIALTQQNYTKELFFVKMDEQITYLEEVKINQYQNINSLSLGILQKPAKQYTLAERRLFTATSGGGIDGLLNLISGRTKMLKKGIGIEKKEMAIEKIENLFDEKYFVETLKIPKEKIKGFEYYCVEDAKFNAVLRSKNKTMTKFLLIDLARDFLILQKEN